MENKQRILDEFELKFKEVYSLLENANRDESYEGRINELTRSVFYQLFLFTEFIDGVVLEREINEDTIDNFRNRLFEVLKEFNKINKIVSARKRDLKTF